ncbi:MAG: hypothetical protein KDI15_12535 [Thiothrix sp.]|nr:hypothetical protein [Thiothrix sp.]HPE61582.1 hypothetical protein [Thiolinea sp.]
MRHWRFCLISFWVLLFLQGCFLTSEEQQVRETANHFWQAVLAGDMEQAKSLASWDTVQYLQYLQQQDFTPQRFETGELKIDGNTAEVATVLYGGDKGEMAIPVRTVLLRGDKVWQVDVHQSMGSMVNGAMGAMVDQLNSLVQQGLKGLDESLSNGIRGLGESLQDGMKQLEKDLSRPLPPPASGQKDQKSI